MNNIKNGFYILSIVSAVFCCLSFTATYDAGNLSGNRTRSFPDTIIQLRPSVQYLHCNRAFFTPGLPRKREFYKGTLYIPYYGGNRQRYPAGTSRAQNGLAFTRKAGYLNRGVGSIEYTVSGTPDFIAPAAVTIPIDFFGQQCEVVTGSETHAFFAK